MRHGAQVGLGFLVFCTLVFIEIFGSPFSTVSTPLRLPVHASACKDSVKCNPVCFFAQACVVPAEQILLFLASTGVCLQDSVKCTSVCFSAEACVGPAGRLSFNSVARAACAMYCSNPAPVWAAGSPLTYVCVWCRNAEVVIALLFGYLIAGGHSLQLCRSLHCLS